MVQLSSLLKILLIEGTKAQHFLRRLKAHLDRPETETIFDSDPSLKDSGPRVVKMVLNTQCHQYLLLLV